MDILSALSNHIGPWLPLLAVPLIIFSATPNMPAWYKSGRILFLWLCVIAISGIALYATLSDPQKIGHWGVNRQAYEHYILLSIWFVFLINVYIGWFEFLWRCVYRQWAWPLLKNLQYGLISNLCILGSAVFTILFCMLMIAAQLHKIF